MAEEWERFDTKPESELTAVRHVTHVPAARRIIEDGTIKAGLVYDKSHLNASRLSSTLPISGSVTKRIRESPQERGGNFHISPVMPGHR